MKIYNCDYFGAKSLNVHVGKHGCGLVWHGSKYLPNLRTKFSIRPSFWKMKPHGLRGIDLLRGAIYLGLVYW